MSNPGRRHIAIYVPMYHTVDARPLTYAVQGVKRGFGKYMFPPAGDGCVFVAERAALIRLGSAGGAGGDGRRFGSARATVREDVLRRGDAVRGGGVARSERLHRGVVLWTRDDFEGVGEYIFWGAASFHLSILLARSRIRDGA